jgi:hypothetical protein
MFYTLEKVGMAVRHLFYFPKSPDDAAAAGKTHHRQHGWD